MTVADQNTFFAVIGGKLSNGSQRILRIPTGFGDKDTIINDKLIQIQDGGSVRILTMHPGSSGRNIEADFLESRLHTSGNGESAALNSHDATGQRALFRSIAYEPHTCTGSYVAKYVMRADSIFKVKSSLGDTVAGKVDSSPDFHRTLVVVQGIVSISEGLYMIGG
ncbi:hypothetical protein [Mailhella massiliensis]|uniref:hypothetical protein n=1 Tax=Mailhella massiliensis TaxID=1903261 RepID=UPI00097D44F6|nr:hypothetical protein [Mailhella massiliensis]